MAWPHTGWMRRMTDAEKRRWWAIVATRNLELAIREFHAEAEKDIKEPAQ